MGRMLKQSVFIRLVFIPLHMILFLPQKSRAKMVLDHRLDTILSNEPSFGSEIAKAIYELWKDPIMPKIMEEYATQSTFDLMDSAA